MTPPARSALVVPLACAALLLGPAHALAAPPNATDPAAAKPPAAAAAAPTAAPAVGPTLPADAPPPTAEERAAMKKKAAAAYKRGRDLLQTKGACDARGSVADSTEALHAFLESLHFVPKPGTTFLAAVCHQALDHLEEALDFYEDYLRLPGIPEDLKLEAQKAVIALHARVGTIVVDDAERGAKVVVDGRARGELPVPKPVVATAGKHLVQVYLEGFVPFEATVGVLPGEVTKVAAHLTRLPRLGQVEVKERDGKVVDVLVDGAVVGHTPWKGQLGEGDHGVSLRGDKDVGSSPVSVNVAADKPAALTLAAERLDATIRIVPEPSGATVLLDTAFVGRGAFEGRLRPGEHTVKVVAEGFLATTQKVTLGAGADETVQVTLSREPAAPIWANPVDAVPIQAGPRSGPPVWAWVVGGAGVVALGAAVGFGADGLITKSNLDNLCSGNLSTCKVTTPAQSQAITQINAQKDRDLGLFVGLGTAGAAAFTVGLVRVLSGPKAPEKSTGALVLSPIAGPGIGGASLGGRF